MDELASLVLTDRLDTDLVKWISATMTETFISDYVVDIEKDGKVRNLNFKLDPLFIALQHSLSRKVLLKRKVQYG
jgi:hypothetical protein